MVDYIMTWDQSPKVSNVDILSLSAPSVANVTLTQTDIADLDTTPFQLLPAPAAGQTYFIHSVESFYDFDTTNFTVGIFANIVFRFTPSLTAYYQNLAPVFGIDGVADSRKFIVPTGGDYVTGEAIELAITNDTISGGGAGALWKLRITYSTVTALT